MEHNPIPPDAKHAQRLAEFMRNLPFMMRRAIEDYHKQTNQKP